MRWPLRSRATARPEGKSRPEATARPDGTRQAERKGSGRDVERPFGQWRALPAVARVLGSPPTADSRGFVRTLPSRWQQAAVLAPLGHDVTTAAPGGLVSGLGRCTDPSISGPAARQRPGTAPGDAATATGPTPIDNGLPRPSRFRLARPRGRSAAPLPSQARPRPEPGAPQPRQALPGGSPGRLSGSPTGPVLPGGPPVGPPAGPPGGPPPQGPLPSVSARPYAGTPSTEPDPMTGARPASWIRSVGLSAPVVPAASVAVVPVTPVVPAAPVAPAAPAVPVTTAESDVSTSLGGPDTSGMAVPETGGLSVRVNGDVFQSIRLKNAPTNTRTQTDSGAEDAVQAKPTVPQPLDPGACAAPGLARRSPGNRPGQSPRIPYLRHQRLRHRRLRDQLLRGPSLRIRPCRPWPWTRHRASCRRICRYQGSPGQMGRRGRIRPA